MKSSFDYDASTIPAAYDKARDHGPAFRELWMDTIARAVDGRGDVERILDVGCGTGRFSVALAERFDADVVGIDPSWKMLQQARSKPCDRISHAVARGEDIALVDDSIDLVFMSMVFHHLRDPWRVAKECRRLVQPGGAAFVRTASTDRSPSYPYVPFIPESRPLLETLLPTVAHVREVFEAAGFQAIGQGVVVQEIAATHAQYVEKLEAGGDSVLARLDPDVFEKGMNRIRAHARVVDPEPVTETIDWLVFA